MQVGELWVRLGLDKRNYDDGLNDARGKAGSFGSYLKNAFQFTVGMGMFDLLRNGIKEAWDVSIGFNSQMQTNQIAFETMLGSADKAQRMLSELTSMAARTPFQLPQLTEVTKKLFAFGYQASEVMPILKSVGDAASGLGLGKEGMDRITLALGQIKAKGKLAGEEVRQLAEAGIPVWEILGKGFNKSTAELMKMSENGLLPASKSIDLLVKGLEEKFPNMMDKQSKSFKGLMTTIRDNVQMTLGGITKPMFEDLTNNVLPNVVIKLEQVRNAFNLEGMKGVVLELFPPKFLNTLAAVTGGFVLYKAAVLASIITTELQGIVTAISAVKTIGLSAATEALAMNMQGATIAQWALNTAMNANPLGIVITLVGSLIAVLAGLKFMTGSNIQETLKLKETMMSAFEEEKQKAIDSINARRQAELDALNSKRNAIEEGHLSFMQKLNEQYGAYKSTQKSMTDIAKEEGEARKKALDEEYNSRIDALQNEIDAIDDKTKAEEQADKDAKNQEKINMLQNKIETARHLKDKEEAQKELNELLKQMDREKLLAQREEQKKAIKKQQDTLKEQLQKEKELVDKSVEDKITAINIERKAKEDAEKLKYEAAKKSIDDEIKKVNEKYDLMVKREDELFKQKMKNIDDLAKKQQAQSQGHKTVVKSAEGIGSFLSDDWWGRTKQLFNFFLNDGSKDFMNSLGYASGTDNATPGVHEVSEEGYEIVFGRQARLFKGGETVLNHSDSKALLQGSKGQSKSVEQHLHISTLNIQSQGDQKRTLQQLQFMAQF